MYMHSYALNVSVEYSNWDLCLESFCGNVYIYVNQEAAVVHKCVLADAHIE